MGSIVEAAIYEYIGKFFLIFVVVPVGIMVLGYIICIIVEVINEIRKKQEGKPKQRQRKESTQVKKLISLLMTIAVLLSVLQPAWAIEVSLNTYQAVVPTPAYLKSVFLRKAQRKRFIHSKPQRQKQAESQTARFVHQVLIITQSVFGSFQKWTLTM